MPKGTAIDNLVKNKDIWRRVLGPRPFGIRAALSSPYRTNAGNMIGTANKHLEVAVYETAI